MKNITRFIVFILLISSVLIGCANQEQKSANPDDEIQTVVIKANEYYYSPSTVEVKPGKVKLIVENTGKRMHGFAIDEFGIKENLAPGQKVEKEIEVTESGEFRFYCTVLCGTMDDHSGMTGKLIVK